MYSLFLLMVMRDPLKHNIILCSKAKLIFVLVHVVTCKFLTPLLINKYDASNTCIHQPYSHSHTANVLGQLPSFFDCSDVLSLFP